MFMNLRRGTWGTPLLQALGITRLSRRRGSNTRRFYAERINPPERHRLIRNKIRPRCITHRRRPERLSFRGCPLQILMNCSQEQHPIRQRASVVAVRSRHTKLIIISTEVITGLIERSKWTNKVSHLHHSCISVSPSIRIIINNLVATDARAYIAQRSIQPRSLRDF